jgi:hypothetical protein
VNSFRNNLSLSEYSDHMVFRAAAIGNVNNHLDLFSCDTFIIIVIISSSSSDVNLLVVSAKWQLSIVNVILRIRCPKCFLVS